MTTVRIRTKNSLGFRGFECGSCAQASGHSETEPKERCNPPLAQKKELRSATAFRVQLTFLNACCSERALKSKVQQ